MHHLLVLHLLVHQGHITMDSPLPQDHRREAVIQVLVGHRPEKVDI